MTAKVIYSGGADLDILPQHASKGKGLEFLLNEVGQYYYKPVLIQPHAQYASSLARLRSRFRKQAKAATSPYACLQLRLGDMLCSNLHQGCSLTTSNATVLSQEA